MSTCNFNYDNILFVIETDYQDENGETQQDDYVYDDTIGNISYDLAANGWSINLNEYEQGGLQSYPGHVFAEYEIEQIDKDNYYLDSIVIRAIVRQGYYSGANFDYEIIDESAEGSEKTKKDKQAIDRVIKKYIKILKRYTTEFKHLGTFSNGEAIYNKA